jgi:hypothetical protein
MDERISVSELFHDDMNQGFDVSIQEKEVPIPQRCSVAHYLMRNLTFGLPTKPPPIEVFSTSATRSALRSCSFAKRTEVAIMCSPRQIFHEAIGSVSVVL